MRTSRIAFRTLLLILVCPILLATGQIPDRLILNGKTHYINTNPLERFFEKFPKKRIMNSRVSTSCWRGYIATFEISNDKLFISSIITQNYDYDKSQKIWKTIDIDVTTKVFSPGDKRICDWYTGCLILPEGEVVNYVHMGYASTHERYQLIKIRNGTIVDNSKMTHSEFIEYRKAKFELFKRSQKYKTALAESIKKFTNEEDAISFLFEFYTEFYLSLYI